MTGRLLTLASIVLARDEEGEVDVALGLLIGTFIGVVLLLFGVRF